MAQRTKVLTLKEFLKLPEEKPSLEYVEGQVTQKALPLGKHSVLQSEIAVRIDNFARPAKLAIVLIELRSIFACACVVPDVSVYLWHRVPTDSIGEIANDFFDPPDLAVEIVSPEESPNALVRRCLWYVANGVQIALLVDPYDESVLLFRPTQVPVAFSDGDRIEIGDVLPGFELTAATLFEALRVQ